MISISAIVREYLTGTNTRLHGLVSSRIALGRRKNDWNEATACIVWVPLPTGESNWEADWHSFDAEFVCYGGTDNWVDSETIARALIDRLHSAQNVAGDEGCFISGSAYSPGQPQIETDRMPEWVVRAAIHVKAID